MFQRMKRFANVNGRLRAVFGRKRSGLNEIDGEKVCGDRGLRRIEVFL